MTKEIRNKMRKGHTCILSLAIALGGVVSVHAGDSPGMPLLDEYFETPDVTNTSLLQDGGTYHKGSLPTGGKWVGATQGFGANRIGIINKTFGDFTAAADNHQGFYFGYTNCGLTSSTSAISHTLELGAKYTLSFDVSRDNNKAQSSYTVQLVAFEPEENDTVRNDVRPGSSPGVVLATLNGTVTTNDLTERVSLVFQPDESIHYRDVGKAIGIRFLGNSSNPIIDNVHFIVDLDEGLGQGVIPDNDGDGLPDAWEMANFGNLNRDGTSDLDRDGLTDAFEYTANLDPNDYDTENGIPDWVGYLDTVNGETLLNEDFENPGVIGSSVLQFGATFDKGKLPASGKWVGSSLGFGADRKGLIHKNFGDFTSPDGNNQGCYFGYTNAGITSSAAAISHVLDQDAIYVLTFDVARDNDKVQSSYAMELVAFSPEQGDVVRNDTRDGSRPGTVLSSASGIVLSNDMLKRVTMIFKPDATLHATHFGKSLGLRFLGNSSCPILDNVSLKVIDTKTIEPGALGYLTVEHWDNVPGHTLTDLFANQAFYQDANWIYLTPWAKSLSNVGNDYGVRMTGRVIASQSGQHQFLLGGGGECQMFLSTDERAFNRREIASFPYIPELEDDMYQGIISDPVNLVAGNEYYIEVLMKEGNDNDRDDVSVAWQFLPAPRPPEEPQVLPRPFEIIPGSSLRSYMPDAGDLDDDGMLDSWEARVGLNSNDNGGTNRNQGSYADIDGDGLLNYQEYQYNTSPLNSDTDGDGMPDGWEVQNNLNPNDSSDADLDSDGDGINNQDESNWGLNPNSADSVGPLNFGFNEEITDYPDMTFRPDHPSDLYDQSSVANWEAVIGHHIEIWDGSKDWNGNSYGFPASETQFAELHSHLGSHGIKQTFEMLPGTKQSFILRYAGRYESWDGVIDNAFSMKVEGAAELVVNGTSVPESGGNRSYPFMESDTGDQWQSWSHASVTITAPQSARGLQPITISFVPKETTSGGEEITHGGFVDLLPVEVAPEVLAVNSDFDEGRIDPVTGYAIPDCDDTNISLEAVRNHLDGKFAVNERITDDMHPGFFGLNPSTLGDEFWAGANVTIRKVDKTDPATGHPESGHIRLYGKWGNSASEYRAIVPYDFDTLATTNLATGGINLASGESVYGATSPFPAGSSYFIEGVHPGKITLEWRYQKGSIDIKHLQSFVIYTKKIASHWRLDLDYKIRLETSNDPSGEIRTVGYPLMSDGYTVNIERAAEFYDYYRECFHEPPRSHLAGYPNAMSWPGLARLAGSQVVGGLSDSQWGKRSLQLSVLVPASVQTILRPIVKDWSVSEIDMLQLALFQGAWQIFQSAGWQHHAFRSSGYEAIEWVATNTEDADAPLMLAAWGDLRQGILDHDKMLIDRAALRITDREQNHTIVPTWAAISGLGVGLVDDMFSILGKNSCTPAGLNFTDLFDVSPLSPSIPPKPLGNLAIAADRWVWIQPGTTGGILDTWNTQPMARKLALSGNSLKGDAMRFSIFSNISSLIPIISSDDADIP